MSMSPFFIGKLTNGLNEESRTKMAITGQTVKTSLLLQASTVDLLRILAWQRTKDGREGTNKPISLVAKLLNADEDTKTFETFDTGEDFDKAFNAIVGD